MLGLPDPGDRHVLAAAIEADADVIVTSNVRDFPPAVLAEHGIAARLPDDFALEVLLDDPDAFLSAARGQRAELRNPPLSVETYLAGMEKVGLKRTVEFLRNSGVEL